jgi:O-acetyl-ADP-ribose deacetylase (regulator of RNase III)
VGPIWRGGQNNEAKLLASCYQECFAVAVAHGMKTIAFPAISCGVYGFPIPAACKIAMEEVISFLDKNSAFERVFFACFNETVERELRNNFLC